VTLFAPVESLSDVRVWSVVDDLVAGLG